MKKQSLSTPSKSTISTLEQPILLGAHMSIEGGLHRALERGHSIGCNTIQLFSKNSNRWAARELIDSEILEFKNVRTQTGIHPVFAHCSYLINLAAPNHFYKMSIDALTVEIQRGEMLGLDFIVLHPGAHVGKGEKEGLKRVANALNEAIVRTSASKCVIVIENTAGQGSCLGCKFEHLEYLFSHVHDPKRLGFCIDTCHLFASGYDIRDPKSYQRTVTQMLNHIPLEKVRAFHLNDSKKDLGTRVDRHEHIGKGFIGLNGFRSLLQDERFRSVPKVLETPKGKDLAEDVVNLKTLRELL
jgi:deoxyribonuclease IV